MTTTAARKTAKVTREQLQECVDARETRLPLDRLSRSHAKVESDIRHDVLDALLDAGQTVCRRGEFEAVLIEGAPSVSWKDEFIRLAGAEAAAAIIQAAAPKIKVDIKRFR